MRERLFVAAFALALVAVGATAAPVVSRPTNHEDAYFADLDPVPGLRDESNIRYESFTLAQDSTIRSVRFWGLYIFEGGSTVPDDFTIAVFSDASGSPATTPLYSSNVGAVASALTGFNPFGDSVEYEYVANIEGPALLAGQVYWIAIYNNTPGDGERGWWWMTTSAGDDGSHRSLFGAGPIRPNARDLAFELHDAPLDPPTCPADLTGDGEVGAPDLAALLGLWGVCD